MRIVITGPTGAIGMALIQKCIDEKISVLAICHKGSERLANMPQSAYLDVFEADLSDLKNIEKKDVGLSEDDRFDIFYHFAWAGTTGQARNNMPLQISNIQYTMDAVELAKRLGCTCFVGAGSQAEYGRVEGRLSADTPAFPENGYGMAKLCAGEMSRVRCEELGIRHIWTRILSVYGPYDGKGSMIMSTILKLSESKRASLTAGGQKWDYLYSEDAAQAMLLLGKNGIGGRTYVIGSGNARPLKEYIEMLNESVRLQNGSTGELGFGDIPYGEKQVMHLEADISLLKADTGFEPQTDFAEGIRKTVEHLLTDRH